VSAGPDPNADLIEQARRQVNRLAEEIARISDSEMGPTEYYSEFLQKLLQAIAAPAGAIWLRTPQGNLQLQYQINMRQVGLDRNEQSKAAHGELLRQSAMKGQPALLPPHSGLGAPEGGGIAPGNPSDYFILIAPIQVEKQTIGLIEIWQDPSRGPDAQRGFLQFVLRMASLASHYTRNHQLRHFVSQQQVWTQLESFSRQVHGSLNPIEVAMVVSNDGRRLVECDRLSVAIRAGGKTVVESISGADVVEKRSNLVRLMTTLFDKVLIWGEKLVYQGTRDDALPPDVLKALDNYLAESNSKLLVVLPLRDEREKESPRPPRSALLMECFEPATAPDQMVARLDVVAQHAAPALYNSSEHKRIPMRFLWMPLAKLQEGLGGKTRSIITLIGVGLLGLIAAMIFVPYPLRMASNGKMLPIKRNWIYSPEGGAVKEIKESLRSGSPVTKDQELVLVYSSDLRSKMSELESAVMQADDIIKRLTPSLQRKDADTTALQIEISKSEASRKAKNEELDGLCKRTNSDRRNPGYFWLRSPLSGIVLSSDFRETLLDRFVKPNDPLLRVGKTDPRNPRNSDWEIELQIPQKHIGHVLQTFYKQPKGVGTEDLDVDLLLASKPELKFMGKLAFRKIAQEANPNRNDNNESEPVVTAWVRIDGDDIPESSRIPPHLLWADTEVHANIRCGLHPMGYSLLYGVWEFLYEKVYYPITP
jgi:hypothetical protein